MHSHTPRQAGSASGLPGIRASGAKMGQSGRRSSRDVLGDWLSRDDRLHEKARSTGTRFWTGFKNG